MTHENISTFIQTDFIYENVTDEEYAAMPVMHVMSILDSVRYIGTDVAVDFLESKLLVQVEPDQQ